MGSEYWILCQPASTQKDVFHIFTTFSLIAVGLTFALCARNDVRNFSVDRKAKGVAEHWIGFESLSGHHYLKEKGNILHSLFDHAESSDTELCNGPQSTRVC